ncbi:hypothetical protein [Clostridium omnivorum]|uniref:DUF4275 family protein n=1 Tax=Clostridium omnivorum TaxID=1604902 RepID=A0ABQ5N6X3_9CLOT|nr:hypothetical protein [Clostridium sp. E14]GLC30964.1 hypothetical protein bsdE14_23740 [Clostridium sp. E14]
MSLDNFKHKLTILTKDEAQNIRNKYIELFVDIHKEYYKKYIGALKKYSDGLCYTGYLWDCIKDVVVIDLQYVGAVSNKLNTVYALWDIHTAERIFIEDYWKFGKDSILKLDFDELMKNLEYLPEDIYIFDENFNWTIVLTHEYIDDKRW